MRLVCSIRWLAFVASLSSLVWMPVQAQPAGQDVVPFFDISRKPERPDLTGLRAIRFLTDDDYPPFHFPGPDGQLTGFNVDLARAICVELKVACTIQPRRWDTLLASLEEGRGDAVIASLSPSEQARARVDFTVPYYRAPGRFVTRKDAGLKEISTATLGKRAVAVVADTGHAAFLATFFPAVIQKPVRDQDEALALLAQGTADAVFGDGISLALWLNGEKGARCCDFVGGAYFESRFFGEGAAIAVRKDSAQLRRAIDHTLFRLAETGVYQNLMLKYFPVSFY
jgi:polar amino acid transport system substrate-binding protein